MQVSSDAYDEIRRTVPRGRLQRAARMLYLNRTAFNGLYRVNRAGEFNVPFGYRMNAFPTAQDLKAAGILLGRAELMAEDFEVTLRRPRRGDFVYLDPPYTVSHNQNGFRRYNEKIFSWEDQVRLATRATELAREGVFVVVSNAAHDEVRRLYSSQVFASRKLERLSRVAATSSFRGKTSELLLVSRNCGQSRQIRRLIRDSLEARDSNASTK